MSLPVDPTTPLLRRGLLWLGGLTCLGLVVELAVERHWTQPLQLVAWVALAVVAAALVLVARRPTSGRIRLARILAGAAILSAVVGVGVHVDSNRDAGELDRDYGDRWASLSDATRWWLAVTKTVGPSPPLAPGALAQAAFCVLLATVRHPALARREEPVGPAERV